MMEGETIEALLRSIFVRGTNRELPFLATSTQTDHVVPTAKRRTRQAGHDADKATQPTEQKSPAIDEVPRWPPDLFAGMSLLLERTGSYTHPAFYEIEKSFAASERHQWIATAKLLSVGDQGAIPLLQARWDRMLQHQTSPIKDDVLRHRSPPEWAVEAFVLLHIADMSCARMGKEAFPKNNTGDNLKDIPKHAPRYVVYANQQREYAKEHEKRKNRVAELQEIEADFEAVTEVFKDTVEMIWELPYVPASICNAVPPFVACVQPKSMTPQVGQTIHSFSHNLALLPPRGLVATFWFNTFKNSSFDNISEQQLETFGLAALAAPRFQVPPTPAGLNLLLVPYPYRLGINAVKVEPELPNSFHVDPTVWLEDLAPSVQGQSHHVASGILAMVRNALRDVDRIDGIILPELALTHKVAECVSAELFRELGEKHGLGIFVSGVAAKRIVANEHTTRKVNAVYTRTQLHWYQSGSSHYTPVDFRRLQIKHHRWRLNSRQIKRYNLSSRLSIDQQPGAIEPEWWEATDIVERECLFWVLKNGYVVSTMVCEDLARCEPVQRVVRAVGPNLLIAVLMDGPQFKWRWGSRYATGLCDDPGGSVLTLTSLGMVRRSQRHDAGDCRNIALWHDPFGEIQELLLPQNSAGLVLSLSEREMIETTASYRHQRKDEASKKLVLSGVRAVATPPKKKLFDLL